MNLKLKIVLAGIGGQGVLFSTKVLSQTAFRLGYDVIGSETHGMSQRGGSVMSHLKIGGYHSPMIREGTADILYGYEKAEAFRNLHYLKDDSLCFVSVRKNDFFDQGIKLILDRKRIQLYTLDADKIALDFGAPLSANLVLIGFSTTHPGLPLEYKELRKTIDLLSPDGFKEKNLNAFDKGFQEGKRQCDALNISSRRPSVKPLPS